MCSYAANLRAAGRRPACLVADDSDCPDHQELTRHTAELTARLTRGPTYYLGPSERRRLAAYLARQARVPADVVEFAILNPEGRSIATGALRNALLLASGGRILLSIDDDTVCRIGSVPGAHAGLSMSSWPDPTEFWFYADRDAAERETAWVDLDLCGELERLVGRTIGSCVSTSGVVSLERCAAHEVAAADLPHSRVPVVSLGLVGDCGMATSTYLSHLSGRSFARLTENESTYRQAFAVREVRRAVLTPTLSTGAFFMSPLVAIDTPECLPPFFPVHRDQDSLFAATLFACRPYSVLGLLPWTILHAPPRRTYDSGGDRPRPTTANLVSALIADFRRSSHTRGTADRLRALGNRLVDIGTLSAAEYVAMSREIVSRAAAAHLVAVQSRLDAGGPPFWKRDMEATQRWLNDLIHAREWPAPVDVRELDAVAATAVQQRLIHRFGSLLQCWPELVSASRDLDLTAAGITTYVSS
jgi:hypothetical protein